MATRQEIDETLTDYRKSKNPNKYQEYVDKLAASQKIDDVTLRRAIGLLKNAPDDEIKGMLKQISDRKILIFIGFVDENHGMLGNYGEWDEGRKEYSGGYMIIDSRYEKNYLGTAGVIAHELRHILDCEETRLGKLNIGIVISDMESLNNDEAQERANIASGRIMQAYGFKKSDWARDVSTEKNYTNVDPRFAEGWSYDDRAVVEMSDNAKLYDGAKGKLVKHKCGRPCKDFEHHGYCDREVYYPPCWSHRSES